MTKIIVYIILFILGYRVLKKFFAPNFGEVDQGGYERQGRDNTTIYRTTDGDKSSEVEDVDYEEVE